MVKTVHSGLARRQCEVTVPFMGPLHVPHQTDGQTDRPSRARTGLTIGGSDWSRRESVDSELWTVLPIPGGGASVTQGHPCCLAFPDSYSGHCSSLAPLLGFQEAACHRPRDPQLLGLTPLCGPFPSGLHEA